MIPRLKNFSGTRLLMACLAFGVLLASAVPALWSQTLSGINGTVTDTAGGVVENARVTVTNNDTAVKKTATTSSAGTYTVTDLIPGRYTVAVEMPGFQISVHNGVGVE